MTARRTAVRTRPATRAGGASPAPVGPLASWFPDSTALERFHRRWLGRSPRVLFPRDRAWAGIVPGFEDALSLPASGVPFQTVLDRRYDRSGDPRRFRRALAAGRTVYFPQAHQVLPRLMRLMVALRVAFLGPFRDECSFLFLAAGRGRDGMGLHHDGDVDSFWLQLEGRRRVTIGPPVPPGQPEDLDPSLMRDRPTRWRTLDLEPGTLFYLPPRTPHRVVYRRRSLAVSLTWRRVDPRDAVAAVLDEFPDMLERVATRNGALTSPSGLRRLLSTTLPRAARVGARTPVARAHATGLAEWDVVAGQAVPVPAEDQERLWAQVPAVAGPLDRRRRQFPLWLPDGEEIVLSAAARPWAASLASLPSWRRPGTGVLPDGLALLVRHGLVAPRDLPLRIIPADPASLDGWRFA